MDVQTLLARTARGTALHKHHEGFVVCDPDGQCQFCGDLYKAEELLRELDEGFDYPYSSGFHEIMH
tara:strand:+ start:166 stop:363 length:198 start_codon:yes stop_codon:yes gene_type:complete